jgi:3-hydroxybutyrate dehydrogenase
METKLAIKGKVAVVTGSTSGIGLTIAKTLAAEGVNIVLNGFGDAGQIESLRKELADKNKIKVIYSNADLSKREGVKSLIDMASKEFGGIDVLINNAGVQHVAPIDEYPDDKWDLIINLNLSAAFHATKLALPIMRKKGWGRIINIASAHGLTASKFKSAYVAAKHGLIGFTKVAALETAEQNITVNSICPGYVKTPLVDTQIADQAKAHNMPSEKVIHDIILAKQPTKKFVTVEEIAGMVVYLCGPNSNSITGAAISIDGGWMAE